jgi:predicted carbohydrate-binding protein with CBM5 and CBM33 domain
VKRTSMIPFAGTAAVAALVVLTPSLASSHGSMESPLSRNYRCFKEGPENPQTAACRAAVQASGTQQLYDWNGYNQNPNGNHTAFVPDGQLCGAGHSNFGGMNLTRSDWVATGVSSGANVTFTYHATAPHSTSYHRMYVTRPGYSLSSPLRWADLQQFCQVGNIPVNNFRYRFNCTLPAGRSGRAILYHVWQRNDSPEAFYACIDVNFGGTNPTPTPTPTATPTTNPTPTPTPTPTGTPTPGGTTWRVGATYAVGQVVTYNGVSYRCIQAHTVHSDTWTPPTTPALWTRA